MLEANTQSIGNAYCLELIMMLLQTKAKQTDASAAQPLVIIAQQ